jgi:hypothetical protein
VGLDQQKYRAAVLGPARRAGPPADLFARYGFTAGLPADAAFLAQVTEVVSLWKSLRSKPGWGKLIDALLAQHADLERDRELTPAAFRARRKSLQAGASRRLDALISDENATHVGPATVARLREAVGAGADDEQVRRALSRAGITVVDHPPELPPGPPRGYAQLVPELGTLGLRLSAEVVFGSDALQAGFRVLGGFRLADGRRLDAGALAAATRQTSAMPHTNARKTPTEAVLAALKSADREGKLDDLLLWEVIGPLRQDAAAGFGQKGIASQAKATGLEAGEAGVLSVALLAQGGEVSLRAQIEEDLAAGRLRAAQSRIGSLPADDELRSRVAAQAAELASRLSQADAELAAGRTEAAARLLAEAAALTDDDGPADRLAGIAPPAPLSPAATVDRDRVLISWQASPAQAGQLRYLVARGTGRVPRSPAEGVVITAETAELHAADADAPRGEDLRYAVFASRGGPNWSAPAAAAATLLAPDVSDVALDVTADTVSAVWRPAAGAAEIRVVRASAGRQTAVESGLTGFSDTGLAAGQEYRYRIIAVYRSADGAERPAAGVTVRALPAPAPVPVEALDVQITDAALLVSWVPPPLGRVDLIVSRTPPPWPPGTEPAPAELSGYGRPVPGAPRPAGQGRVVVQVPPPPGRHYLLAVTWVGARAVAGARAELGLAEPCRGLDGQRLLDDAQLSWIWPDGAVAAIISWPGGERRCSRREYDDEAPVSIPVGPAAAMIRVSAVHADPPGELLAPAVPVTIAARGARVRYRWLKGGPLHPGRRLLELTTDRDCELPELVVVQSAASFPPGEAADGVEVTRLPGAPIRPGTPLRVPVQLPRRASGFLACFTAAGRDADVLLFPPPPGEMRIP